MGRLSPTFPTGRFAPSPSGALHFGSLLAALASFLDIRARSGRWLVRMEDLDPAREPHGAADLILRTLESFALHWDGEVVYQSRRLPAYQEALEGLRQAGLIYACDCSRKRIKALGGVYDGHCRHRSTPPPTGFALRVKVPDQPLAFPDRILGRYRQQLRSECGDFVVLRRDGLFAYQLAVVVDDAWQGVTDVLRGSDLLDSTPRQLYLQSLLDMPHPTYAHIPVASNQQGQKLSKQHFARPLQPSDASNYLYQALQFLGQHPPQALSREVPEAQICWAISHWDIQRVPKLANIAVKPTLG